MKKCPNKSPSRRDKSKHSNDSLITLAERVTDLFDPGSILILWRPDGLASWRHVPTRLVAQDAVGHTFGRGCGTWWRPGRTCIGRGPTTFAVVGPFVVARGLVTSLVPHSFLDFGNGVAPQRPGLGRGRLPFPRCLLLFLARCSCMSP